MTVSSTTSRVSYSTNGVTTLFQFPYYFLEEADLVVVVKNDSTGVETTLVLNTDYTVAGEGVQAGGSITTLSVIASGSTISIYRDPDAVQEVDLRENDNFPSESVEMALDRITMISQRLADVATRSVTLSEGTPAGSFDPTLPEVLTPETVVQVNAAGDGFEEGPSSADIAAAATNAATAVAAAATATAAAATVTSAFYRDVVYKTSADSPITISTSDNGKLYSIDSSGGAVSVTLPQLSSLTPPFNIAFVLKTAGNNLTINRSGSDTIAGSTSKVISTAGVGCQLVGDTDSVPDEYSVLDFGTVADSALTLAKLATQVMSPGLALNYSLTASVAANALTIAVKTAAGTDPSASDPVYIWFRNTTAGTGTYTRRTITSALSMTVSSGSTLGHVSGKVGYIFPYFLDNSGTVELAVAGLRVFDEASLQTTTAEGGAGAADSKNVLYSTTARTSKPILLAGRLTSTQATAGTWATAISEIALKLSNHAVSNYSEIYLQSGPFYGGGASNKVFRFTDTVRNVGSAVTYTDDASNGANFTINEDGIYAISCNAEATTTNSFGFTVNAGSLTTSINSLTKTDRIALSGTVGVSGVPSVCATTAVLFKDDVLRVQADGSTFTNTDRGSFRIIQLQKFS